MRNCFLVSTVGFVVVLLLVVMISVVYAGQPSTQTSKMLKSFDRVVSIEISAQPIGEAH